MNKIQAENKAELLNATAKHPSLSYVAHTMPGTRFEHDRWAVLQRFDGEIVGIAQT